MGKSFRFSLEAAETLGLNNAILLDFLKSFNLPSIEIKEILKEITFWDENEILEHLIELDALGMISVDFNKKKVSLEKKKSKSTISTPKKINKSSMEKNWVPSEDVIEILTRAGMNENFIRELIPEFIIYWSERKDVLISYDSKFIEHARLKWAQHNAEIETKSTPKTIQSDWQPSTDCMDIIQMTGIDKSFSDKYLPEFILYWKDDGRAFVSWDIKFLDFIKKKWNYHIEDSSNGHREEFDFYDPTKETVEKTKSKTLSSLREKYKI